LNGGRHALWVTIRFDRLQIGRPVGRSPRRREKKEGRGLVRRSKLDGNGGGTYSRKAADGMISSRNWAGRDGQRSTCHRGDHQAVERGPHELEKSPNSLRSSCANEGEQREGKNENSNVLASRRGLFARQEGYREEGVGRRGH